MSDKEGITPEARSAQFNALPPKAKEGVLSQIKLIGQEIGKKLAGSAAIPPKNLAEQVKYMSDTEREALIEVTSNAQREELKRLHGE